MHLHKIISPIEIYIIKEHKLKTQQESCTNIEKRHEQDFIEWFESRVNILHF